MVSLLKKIYPLILIIISNSCVHVTALMDKWPDQRGTQNGGRSYNNAPVKNVSILLNNNEVLTGTVKFVPFPRDYVNNTTYIFFLPFGKSEKKDIRLVKGDSIKFVRVYPDIPSDSNHYADYYRFREKNYDVFMWYLAQKKEMGITVHDIKYSSDTVNPKNFFINLIDLKQNSIVELNHLPLFLPRQNLQKELLKIINERYRQDFKEENFKDVHAMADYILDKELEKQEKR